MPALAILSCATAGAPSSEIVRARSAYEQQSAPQCALREEAARRHDAEIERDGTIIYNVDQGTGFARSPRLKASAQVVAQAMAPVRERLRACQVGEVDEELAWKASFSVTDKTVSAHDPATAACVSSVLGNALSSVDLATASRVTIAIGGEWSKLPALSRSQIDGVIKAHRDEINTCFAAAVPGWPELSGVLKTKFIIAPDGHVQISATAASTLHHHGVECCVLNIIDRMRFPPVPNHGIVVVTYPFLFRDKP